MLTRLKVKGFKNLVDVDVRFGPFTCIAGPNNVGKSNLFDAILVLSALADRTFTEAALHVRDEAGRAADLRGLFHRVGGDHVDQMSFDVEMIVPATGTDDLGQPIQATTTFLRYSLVLGYRAEDLLRPAGPLELIHEELTYIRKGDAAAHLPFPHHQAWRASAITGQRRGKAYISTTQEGGSRIVEIHQDGRAGRPLRRVAETLPRTVLSATNATESPTASLARQELRSWRLLHLEPSALRRPDELTAPTSIGEDGSHVPATLYHLARAAYHGEAADITDETGEAAEAFMYGQIAVRLYGLISGISEVTVDRDEKRELLTLVVSDRTGTAHPARALSDGTLRFLALSVLELDTKASGLWCLEEPENGIHPERIAAMVELLHDIATNVNVPIGQGNTLRQVIINTHSPVVVGLVPEDSLLVADVVEAVSGNRRFPQARFSALPDTWRQKVPGAARPISLGTLLTYLSPIATRPEALGTNGYEDDPGQEPAPARRVIDRPEIQLWLFNPDAAGA